MLVALKSLLGSCQHLLKHRVLKVHLEKKQLRKLTKKPVGMEWKIRRLKDICFRTPNSCISTRKKLKTFNNTGNLIQNMFPERRRAVLKVFSQESKTKCKVFFVTGNGRFCGITVNKCIIIIILIFRQKTVHLNFEP